MGNQLNEIIQKSSVSQNRYKEGQFFSLKLTFEARKVRVLESIFLQNENSLRVRDFVDKNLRLLRISLLISAIQRVLHFSREIYLIKAIENFFPVFA